MNDLNDAERLSLGQRLREGRNRRGLSIHDVAEQLHLPLSVVESLEAERFEQLGAPVYVRGHLRAYLRLLDLPEVLLQTALHKVGEAAPALRSSTQTPKLKYLADRYAMRAVYALLTVSIIVPALWLATQHAGIGDLRGDARVLDIAPPEPIPTATPSAGDELASGGGMPPPRERETVSASMAPFHAPVPPEPELAAEPASEEAADGWLLRLSQDSWVEILDRDGRRLEYGLLRANSEFHFDLNALGKVSLGNAHGVELSRGGETLDLTPFQRANVARFEVSSDGSLQPARD